MRSAHRLFLVAAMVLAAAAFAAPSAFGQIEVVSEDTSNHCGDVTVAGHEAGGECQINVHSISSSHLPPQFGASVLLSSGGIALSVCENEYEGYLSEDGSGLITHQELSDVPGLGNSCQVEVCKEDGGGEEPWPIQWTEPVAGVEEVLVLFCLSASGTEAGASCEISVTAHQEGHHYVFAAEDANCHGVSPVEVTGEWESEGEETNAEVAHVGG